MRAPGPGPIQPLDVVDEADKRLRFGVFGQQAQQGQPLE
jgi:hypothetical protein